MVDAAPFDVKPTFDATEIPVAPSNVPGPESARDLLREILQHTGEVAYRYRLWPTLGYEYISDTVVDLLGYTPEELYADPALPEKLVYPDDADLMRSVLDAPDGEEVEVVLRWLRRDGRVVSTELRCVLSRDATGRPVRCDGMARDVTQREVNGRRLQLIQRRGASRGAQIAARPARVLLADSQALARAGLRTMLADDPGLELVAEAENGPETVRLAQMLEPDLACVDVELPGLDALETTRQIKAVSPMTSVLVLGVAVKGQLLLEAVKAGAAGYVLKDTTESALRSSIWEVLAGDLAVDQRLARQVLRELAVDVAPARPAPTGLLSAREQDVLQLLARGLTNREIAEVLVITPSTVKIHVEHILGKLGVGDRTQAAVQAIELGYVVRERRRA